jgi:insulysin
MLTLLSQYPSENEYSKYLTANNGGSNAWTAMTSTNYFFDVAPGALEGALDRFAGFFIEPLFAEDCTEREINAVNSEHKKNIQHDMWVSTEEARREERHSRVVAVSGSATKDPLSIVPHAHLYMTT